MCISVKSCLLTIATGSALAVMPADVGIAQQCPDPPQACQGVFCAEAAGCLPINGTIKDGCIVGGKPLCLSLNSSLPGPPRTQLGQALVSIANYAWEFVVNADNGHVMYSFWKLGGGNRLWYDLGPIGGNVVATSAPAATAIGTYVFLTVTGSDNQVHLNQGSPPNWVGWR